VPSFGSAEFSLCVTCHLQIGAPGKCAPDDNATLKNQFGAGALNCVSSLTNMKTAHLLPYIMC